MAITKAPATTRLTGNSDNTRIGNVGDSLKVASSGDGLSNDPRPPFNVVWVDKRASNGSNQNMAVDGDPTPQDFIFTPPAGEVWYLKYISILLIDPGSPDPGDFGGINGGLTNGLELIQKINGTEYELGNFKDNISLSLCFSQYPVIQPDTSGWFNEDDMYMGTKVCEPEITLRGDDGDQIIFRVNDDIDNLDGLYAVLRAWRKI